MIRICFFEVKRNFFIISEFGCGKTAINAVERSLNLGFDAVNVDLIFALPGQTLDPNVLIPYSDLGKEK